MQAYDRTAPQGHAEPVTSWAPASLPDSSILHTTTMKIQHFGLLCLVASTPSFSRATVLLTEGFDNIGTLAGSGWTIVNNSSPLGSTSYFQGNTGVFSSQAGAGDSYIAANFNNAGLGGNISNWLILPTLTLDPTTQLSFYTQSANFFPDRLEVRMSTNGASADVGITDASTGDFSNLLLTINPSLDLVSYPSLSWQQYSVSLSSLGGPTNGRLAFRYLVPDTNTNGDYIGIDTVKVENVTATVPDAGATFVLLVAGLAATGTARRFAFNGRKPTNHA